MVSLFSLSEVTEEGVRFRSPYDGQETLLSPERSVEIQNALGKKNLAVFPLHLASSLRASAPQVIWEIYKFELIHPAKIRIKTRSCARHVCQCPGLGPRHSEQTKTKQTLEKNVCGGSLAGRQLQVPALPGLHSENLFPSLTCDICSVNKVLDM